MMKVIISYLESHAAIIGVILVIILVAGVPARFTHRLVSKFGERTLPVFQWASWIFFLIAIILAIIQLFKPALFSSLFPLVPIFIGIGAAYRTIANRLRHSNPTENCAKKN